MTHYVREDFLFRESLSSFGFGKGAQVTKENLPLRKFKFLPCPTITFNQTADLGELRWA